MPGATARIAGRCALPPPPRLSRGANRGVPQTIAGHRLPYLANAQYTGSATVIRTQIGWNEVKQGLRILYFLGIQNKDRKYFWKMLYLVKIRHRKSMDMAIILNLLAVQMAITAQHLREQAAINIEELKQPPKQLASA
jgi:hypothetical protein